MLRNTLLGLAAALALGTAALAPTAASAGPNFSVHIGGFGPGYGYGPYYGYGPAYYDDGPDCTFKDVKVWSNKWQKFIWKTKKICY
jgi:hypothetical protein